MPDLLSLNGVTKATTRSNMKLGILSLSVLVSFIFVTLMSLDANAADKKDKSARRLQQMAQQLQQAEQEKADLQAQIDAAKKATTEAEAKLKQSDEAVAVLSKKLATSERKVTSLTTEVKKITAEKVAVEDKLQKTETQLEITQKNLAELNDKYQIAQNDLKVGESQRKVQLASIQQKSASLDVCEQKNTKLYGFGLDLIKTFEKPSQYEMVLRTEKFTQLKRVELENMMQEYRDKLEESRIISTNR